MQKVSVGLLRNGMYYYGKNDSSNASGIGVRMGAACDPRDAVGFHHLIEHLRATESPRHPGRAVDLTCEKYMGTPEDDINVRIDRISTFYGHNMLLYRRHMIEVFEMFADMVKCHDFTEESFDVERAAIHQEHYLYGRDQLTSEIDDLMYQTMFSGHIARRIDCEPDHLRNLERHRVKRAIRNAYVPSNMFAVMLGPPFKEVTRLMRKNFGDFTRPAGFRLKLLQEPTSLGEVKSKEVVRPGFHQTHVAIGFATEHFLSPDREAIDVLSRLLAFRVRRRLRDGNRDFDKGVYRALSYTDRSLVHGMLYIWYATSHSEYARYGEQVVLEECMRLCNELVPTDELDAMVTNLVLQHRDAFTNNINNLVELIIEASCNGDKELVMLHSTRERLRNITRRSLRNVANKVFTLPNHARVVIRPA